MLMFLSLLLLAAALLLQCAGAAGPPRHSGINYATADKVHYPIPKRHQMNIFFSVKSRPGQKKVVELDKRNKKTIKRIPQAGFNPQIFDQDYSNENIDEADFDY